VSDHILKTHLIREVGSGDVCGECRRPIDEKAERRRVKLNPGDVIELDDLAEIERLVKAGAIDDPNAPARPVAPVAAVPDEPDEPGTEIPTVGEVVKPPKAGSQPAWVEYAVSKGLNRDEAAAMSKEALIAALSD
jgi:hypothetical protein